MIKKFSHTVTTLVSMLLLAALVVVIPSTARAADGDPVAGYDYTFYVNDVRTRQDRSPGDGACVSSANAAKTVTQYVDTSGADKESCSFLAAVQEANALPATAKILIVPASQVWVPSLSGSNWVNNSSAGSWQTNANVKLELDNDPGHNSADMVASGSLGSLTGGVDNAGGSGATIRVRYLFAHDNVTVDLQNRYGFESDDTTPSLGFGLITGKNITLRNVARIQANEDGIIIGSSARDITIENSLIGNPPGSTATQWDYAIENGIAIFEGADGIDINHVQFDRAYYSAITFLRSSATGDDIRNVTVRNSTWTQTPNAGGYDPIKSQFVGNHSTGVTSSRQALAGTNIVIRNNTITGWGSDGGGSGEIIKFQNGKWNNLSIEGNTFVGPTSATSHNPIWLDTVDPASTIDISKNQITFGSSVNLGNAEDRAAIRVELANGASSTGIAIHDNHIDGGKSSRNISLDGYGRQVSTYRNTMSGVGGTATAATENGAIATNNIYNGANGSTNASSTNGLRTVWPSAAVGQATCEIDITVNYPTTTSNGTMPTGTIAVDAFGGPSADMALSSYLGRKTLTIGTVGSDLPAAGSTKVVTFDYPGMTTGDLVRLQTVETSSGRTSAYSRTLSITGVANCAPRLWIKQGGWFNDAGTITATQEDPTYGRMVKFDVATSKPLAAANTLTAAAFTLGGTAPGKSVVSVTQNSPTRWTLIVKANGSGTITPDVVVGAVKDLAGAGNTADANTWPAPGSFAGYTDAAATAPVAGAALDRTVTYLSPLEMTKKTAAVAEPDGTDTLRVDYVDGVKEDGQVIKAPSYPLTFNPTYGTLVPDAAMPTPSPAQTSAGVLNVTPTIMLTIENGKNISVAAIDNLVVDGTRTVPVGFVVASSDPEFDGLVLNSTTGNGSTVTVTDNDKANALQSVLTVTADNAAANGTATNILLATVKNSDGALVSNAPVTFSVPTGTTWVGPDGAPGGGDDVAGGVGVTVTRGTSAAGAATLVLTSADEGAYAVAATVNSPAQAITGSPQTVTFTEIPIAVADSHFTVSTGSKIANGTDDHTITVTLKNTAGVAATGWASYLAATSSPSSGVTVGAFTETSTGVYKAPVTSTLSGGKTVTVTLDADRNTGTASVTLGLASGGNAVANFVAGAPAAGNSSVSITPGTRLANNSDAHTVTVTLKDSNGNAVTGSAASLSSVVTDNANGDVTVSNFTESGTPGVYTATVVSKEAGSQTISVSYTGVGSLGSVVGAFVAGAVDLDNSSTLLQRLTSNPQTVANPSTTTTADTGYFHTVRATLVDQFGNPVAGQAVTFALPAGVAVLGGGSATVTTNASGQATLNFTTTVAGSSTITASTAAGVIKPAAGVTATFVAGTPDFSFVGTSISATTGSVEANGVAQHAATVTVRDGFGNPIQGESVEFDALPAGLSLAGGSSLTGTSNASGQYSITVVASTPATYDITAKVNATAVTTGSPAQVTFSVGAPDPTKSTFTVAPTTSQVVGSTFTATVTVKDSSGHPVAGQTVTLNNIDGVTVQTASPTSNASGVATWTLTSTVAGPFDLEAFLGAAKIDDTKTIVFTADDPNVGAAGQSTLAVTTAVSPVVANGVAEHEVTATVKDQHGNPISGRTVTFTVPGAVTPSSVTATTNAAGKAIITLTSTTAGTYDITASVGGAGGGLIENGSPATITFAVGAVAPGNSLFTLTPAGPLVVGGSYTATVTVRDAFNNPVPGAGVSFAVSPTATFTAAGTTNASGQVSTTVTSNIAGTYNIAGSIIVSGSPVAVGNADREFVADAADAGTSTFVTQAGSVVADGFQTRMGTITVKDQYGNPVAGQTVVIVAPADVSPTGTVTLTTNSAGVATQPFTSTKAGTYTLQARLDSAVGAVIDSGTIEFTYGAAAAGTSDLVVSPVSSLTVGTGSASRRTLTATVKDAFGNPVPGVVVDFGATTSVGDPVAAQPVLSATSATTNASGVASVTVTSTLAGSFRFTAKIAGDSVGNSPSGAVTWTADAADAGTSTLTVTPGVVAVGTGSHAATVTVRDQYGNIVTDGQAVAFSVTGLATASISPASVTSNVLGQAVATITSDQAGTAAVQATIGGAPVSGSPANVQFAYGAASAAHSSWVVTGGPSQVAGSGQYTAVVTVRDTNDQLLPGAVVAFTLDPSVTVVEAGPYATGADGKVTVHFTSNTAGTTQASAFLGADQIGADAPLTFTAAGPDVGAAGLSVISATTGDRLANGSATHRVTVLLKDQYGNVISGTPVAFQLPAGVSPVGATTVSTALDGTAYLDVKSTTAGVYGVTATVGSALVENGSPANVTFVAGLVSLTSSTIEATPATIDAVTGTSTVVVTLRDANGNLVSAPHAVVISTNLGVVSATSAGTPGKYSATLMAPSTGGTATLSFTVNALPATPVATVKVLAPALLPCRLDLKLNVTEVRAGETVMATVTGARPGENVVAVLNPSGLALGTIVAGPTGTAVFELKLPASLALGSHSVVVTSGEGCMPVFATMTLLGDEEVESDDTQETPPTANPSLPATGLQLGIEVPIGALMLLVAGGFMLARNRREGETD